MQSTVPDLAGLAFGSVHGLMLLGMVLIIFRPFFPGLAVIGGAVLAYVGLAFGISGVQPNTFQLLALGGVLFFSFGGLFSSWWSEKLGVRFTYITPEVLWGGFLGLILVTILGASLFFQIIALFAGAMVAAIAVQKRGFKDAVAHGPLAIYSMLGPRGFQLLMSLLVSDLALAFLLRPFALPMLGAP